jgi:hypothetical protein
MILSFHCAHDLTQALGGGRGKLRDADPPMDAVGWEVGHLQQGHTGHEERERSTRHWSGGEKVGDESPPRSTSYGEWDMK